MLRELYLAGGRAAGGRRRERRQGDLEPTIGDHVDRDAAADRAARHTSPPQEETQIADGRRAARRASRLQWARWRARIKVTLAALAVAVVVGAVAFAAKKLPAGAADGSAAAAADAGDEEPGCRPWPAPNAPPPAAPQAGQEAPGASAARGQGRASPAAAEEAAPPAGDATLPPHAGSEARAPPLLEAVRARSSILASAASSLGELRLVLVEHLERRARRVVRVGELALEVVAMSFSSFSLSF